MSERQPGNEVKAGVKSGRGGGALFDDDELARRARTTIAGADVGLLLVADGGPLVCSHTVVSVRDDGGEAILSVPTDDAQWLASPRRHWGSLILEPNETFGVGLTLSGRLDRIDDCRRADRHTCGGPPYRDSASPQPRAHLTSVVLRVEQVRVSCPKATSVATGGAARELTLLSYASAEPDYFAANARRVIAHLNSDHPDHLRAWVCAEAGVNPLGVAGISLTELTHERLALWSVGLRGADEQFIHFDVPVHTIEEFAAVFRRGVRTALGHDDCNT